MNPLRRFRPLVAVLAIVAIFATACGGSDAASDNTVIASINGRELTQGQLDEVLPDGDNTVPERIASVVESWLSAQAVEFELTERGYAPTDEDFELADGLVGDGRTRNDTEREQLVNALAISYAVGRWSQDEVAGEDDPTPPNYLCSNHLLVETEEEAAAALERFNEGEAFADLAIELSTGPSGPSGGDLGCAVEGSFVPEFEEAAYAVEAGEVAGPVETTFGWHLIEVETVGPATEENHPSADPAELAQIAFAARESQIDVLIFELEIEAGGKYRDAAFVADSIGVLDDDSLDIVLG